MYITQRTEFKPIHFIHIQPCSHDWYVCHGSVNFEAPNWGCALGSGNLGGQ